MPAQAPSSENDPGDFLQFSITRSGDEESYSLRGFKGASKEIARLILCVGLAVGLTVASIVYVLHVLIPGPARDKVYSSLGIAGATMIVLMGSWARHWLTKKIKGRLRKRPGPTSDADSGQPRLTRRQRPSAVTAESASQAAVMASAAVTPIQTTARSEPDKPDEAHTPAAVAVIPASTQ